MVLYTCLKCNKEFGRKCNYITHINKKFSCEPKIIKQTADVQNKDNHPKKSSIHSNSSDKHKCKFCLKNFLNTYNLKKHINNNCKIKKENEKEKDNIFKELIEKDKVIIDAFEEIKNLKEKVNSLEIKNLKEKINSLENNIDTLKKKKSSKIVNNITNNNTNNIIMINYGKENLQIIDKREFIDKIVKDFKITGLRIPNELLKLIHFNDKYPELKNIYISDINRNKCMIYEDGKWKLSAVDKIPEIVDKIIKYSNEKNEELTEQYKNNKNVISRLKVIDKYTKLADDEHLQDLIDNEAPKKDIQRCKKFKQDTHDLIKVSLYNEGKNIKT